MESSECIYGMLKRRWPIVTAMRTNLANSMSISLAVCILHNIAVKWGMPQIGEDEDPEEEEEEEEIILLEEFEERADVRARADILRNRMRENMPPPSNAEIQKMRANNV